MPQQRRYFWPVVTIIVAILVLLISLPSSWKTWAPQFLRAPSLHLGLDLVGGTQLDFRISEEEIQQQKTAIAKEIKDLEAKNAPSADIDKLRFQQQSIEAQEGTLVEAIRTVIERRINALGVSEATITPSFIGNEKHLLVECPGIIDTQKCIEVVGKTIQLEFKEEFTEATEDFTKGVRAKADETYRRITAGSNLRKEGQDLSDQLGVSYQDGQMLFKDQLPTGLEDVWQNQPKGVLRKEVTFTAQEQDENGQTTEKKIPGIFLVEILKPRTQTGRLVNEAPKAFTLLAKSESGTTYSFQPFTRIDEKVDVRIAGALKAMKPGELKSVTTQDNASHVLFLRGLEKGEEQAEVSHILVSYKGASAVDAGVTRTKEEALQRAKDLKTRIDVGAKFEDIAKAESDGPSKQDAGKLGTISRGMMPPPFDEFSFNGKTNAVSGPIETQYGYHLIRIDKEVSLRPDTASYDDLKVVGAYASKRADGILARMQAGNVRSSEEAITLRSLFFSLTPTGWKDTQLNGKHFRSASVSLDQVTNIPVVQILFNSEGGKLFQELTKKNIGKRIAIFVGGQLVSAPVVQDEIAGGSAVITGSKNFDEAKRLAQDLNTGAIPAPIYLVGQYTIEATLGAAALQTSLKAALVGIIILMVYMIFMYRALGLVANLALSIYAILLAALLKLPLLLISDTYIVLTLAGMAGIILSIGMAVDANVLVFERMKEELRKGKLVRSAVETSFKHAWPAIRDSNISALITCAILFMIGTSIIRGFAITLAMGILLSMFTAIIVTRWMLRKLVTTSFAEKTSLFCSMPRQTAAAETSV